MNILSLFDGIACGKLALERAGKRIENYYASEIEPNAIKVAMTNHPDIIQLGDVTKLRTEMLPRIDLLMGGSPCQSISTLGDGSGLEGKSGLFYEYLRIKEEVKPRWFLLENVRGNKKAVAEIRLGENLSLTAHRKRIETGYIGRTYLSICRKIKAYI